MTYNIQRAAVIGAGIMGAGIAALLASAGVPTLLLDIVPPDAQGSADPAVRNKFALGGIERALKARPASAFFSARAAQLVTPGNTEDDLDKLAGVDWIVEAIVEEIDAKRDLFARIEKVRKPGTIVSSNTSGLPATMLLEGRGEEFRRHFLITHFFNPVRFMKLLEVVAGPETDPDLMAFMGEFCSARLGKGVVYCKDRPSFIGNRIGNYGFAIAVRAHARQGLQDRGGGRHLRPGAGPPEVRRLPHRRSGGRGYAAARRRQPLREPARRPAARRCSSCPAFIREMVARKWLGDKTGQGFYKRVKGEGGKSEILVLDPATMEYRAQDSVHFSSLDSVKGNPDAAERVRSILNASDRAAQLAWDVTADTLLYTAAVAPEIADDVVNIDNAMRWGFNWDAGPFQTWDLLGVGKLVARMEAEGRMIPPLVREVANNGVGSFYHDGQFWDWNTHSYQPLPASAKRMSMTYLRKSGAKIVRENRGASLIDMGDGVLGVEFHTKMNSLDDDIAGMLTAAVEEAKTNWRAIVIGNDAPDFSVGANLAQVLMAARMRPVPADRARDPQSARGEHGAEVQRRPGRRGASGTRAGRRLRDRAARPACARGSGDVSRAGRGRRGPRAGGRRLQRDARPLADAVPEGDARGRPVRARAPRLRDHRRRDRRHQRGRRAAVRLPQEDRRRDAGPRATAGGRQGRRHRAGGGARRAASGRSRRRRRSARPARARGWCWSSRWIICVSRARRPSTTRWWRASSPGC